MFLFLRYRSSQSDISTQNAEDTNHYYVIVQLTSGHEQQDTAQFVRNNQLELNLQIKNKHFKQNFRSEGLYQPQFKDWLFSPLSSYYIKIQVVQYFNKRVACKRRSSVNGGTWLGRFDDEPEH